jgi:hypothetical protein
MTSRAYVLAALALLAAALPAAAHVSERALVLLLPTGVWVPAGAAAVAASALILALAPPDWARRATGALRPGLPAPQAAGPTLSLLSAAALLALVAAGWLGTRDPLENPLPLVVWTGFYIAFPLLQLLLGDLWAWLNPWTGPHALLSRGRPAPFRLPPRLGQWPAVVVWLLISGFALADPAPADPARLAGFALGYWAAILAATLLFGRGALHRVEGFTAWLSLFSAVAPPRAEDGRLTLRAPGARLARAGAPLAGGGVFVIAALGAGSFDGLNETFLWFDLIGVNPLEYPGRSALIAETSGGLLLSVLALAAVFAACVAGGLALAGAPGRFPSAFGRFALTLAPIAVGYHVAHYLTVLLVNGQYLLAAIAEPLGLGPVHVTTSFFNRLETVRLIWLGQAGAVVLGHIAGVFAAHAVAVDLLGDGRRAALSQIPLAVFMVLYTLFGLWLLASAAAG